ncbi:MAG: triosephosphate isomerase [Candidatus Tokpelaia sp. JSC085]|nr:MAG: triosephosphate isomerase [Candidatus Tokpelaia sp. JSC085]
MKSRKRPLIAGNWKMNGTGESLIELHAIAAGLERGAEKHIDALVCLPATLLSRAAETLQGKTLLLGGEDCHYNDSGAHTGDISATMLKDAGADYVIVGHSERRINHHETNAIVRTKAAAACRAGLQVIICVGETLQQRESGQTLDVITRQCLDALQDDVDATCLVIAYEPVWAIGTGKTPIPRDVAEVHAGIRDNLYTRFGLHGNRIRVLYGGSVNPGNAETLLNIDQVDGVLVGHASLKAADFLAICDVYRQE